MKPERNIYGEIEANYCLFLCAKSLQPCLILCNPMDCSTPVCSQAPLSMGILLAGILEGVAMPSSRDFPDPWIEPTVSCVSCIGRRILYC